MNNLIRAIFFSLALLFSVAAVVPVHAAILNQNTADQINENANTVGVQSGYDTNTTVAGVVAAVIKGFLGLMGIIFVIIIIISGFQWMTAGGNEEQVKKATDHIRNAVIGLIIVVAAYSITYFVFANLPGSDGGGYTPPN